MKVLVQFQQRCCPVEFTRVPGTPDVILLKDAVRQVFCDVPKLAIPGAELILRYFMPKILYADAMIEYKNVLKY